MVTELERNQSWRDYRTCTKKQRVFLDWLTQKGPWAKGGPLAHQRTKTPFGLYGGAGWGGKSYTLRTAAMEICMTLRDLGLPNEWGVLACDTYPNLQDRHISKIAEEFEGIGTFQETTKRGYHVKLHGEGLGGVYLRNLDNPRRGTEYAFGLIDEITELNRTQFDAFMYTIRSGRNLPFVALGAATNPDGLGHQWVKDIFHPDYRNLDDPIFKSISAKCFLYVQALKSDNPAYATQKEVIDSRMAFISDEDIRRARDEGAWDLYASSRFAKFSRKTHGRTWAQLYNQFGIPAIPIRKFLEEAERFGFELYSSLDYATADSSTSAYLQHLVDPEGRPWTFHGIGMKGIELEDQADIIHQAEAGLKMRLRYADPAIRAKSAEREDGLTRQERFANEGLWFELAVNDRVEGAASVAYMLHIPLDQNRVATREPYARIIDDPSSGYSCNELLTELPVLPRNPANPEDVDPCGGKWHWYDSYRYFIHTRFKGGTVAAPPPVAFSSQWLRELGASQAKSRSSW